MQGILFPQFIRNNQKYDPSTILDIFPFVDKNISMHHIKATPKLVENDYQCDTTMARYLYIVICSNK